MVLNKIDVPDARELAEMVQPAAARGLPVHCVSTVTTEGLRELRFALGAAVRGHRLSLPPAEPTRVVLRPPAVDESGFEVTADPDRPGGFIVHGARPQRWVRQTNFDNAEAVGYLADRLARLGIEDALAGAGARAGCPVTIGHVTFDSEYPPRRPERPRSAWAAGGRTGGWTAMIGLAQASARPPGARGASQSPTVR